MVLVEKLQFFQFFLLGNIAQKNVFYDILEQNNDFLRHKNKKFKKSKNGFGQKMAIFPTFFLANIG